MYTKILIVNRIIPVLLKTSLKNYPFILQSFQIKNEVIPILP